MASNVIVLSLFLLIVYSVAQFWISRQKSPYLGFILPVFTFVKSIVYSFSFGRGMGHMGMMHNRNRFSGSILWFVLYNIPTAILLLIYYSERKKMTGETIIKSTNPDLSEAERYANTEEELRRMDEVEKMDLKD